MRSDTNLAGRAGRWSAAHWKTAAFGWIALAIVAVAAGSFVGAKQFKPYAYANGDSRRAEEILDRADFKAPARESVLVQSRTAKVGSGLFTAALADLGHQLQAQPDVTNIVSPLDHPNAGPSQPTSTRRSCNSRSAERPRTQKTRWRRSSRQSTASSVNSRS